MGFRWQTNTNNIGVGCGLGHKSYLQVQGNKKAENGKIALPFSAGVVTKELVPVTIVWARVTHPFSGLSCDAYRGAYSVIPIVLPVTVFDKW